MIDQNDGRSDDGEAASLPVPNAPAGNAPADPPAPVEAAHAAPEAPILDEAALAETAAAEPPASEPPAAKSFAAEAEASVAHKTEAHDVEANEVEAPEPARSAPHDEAASDAPAHEEAAPKRRSALLPVAGGICVALLCVAGYYSWSEYSTPDEAPVKVVTAPKPAPAGSVEPKPDQQRSRQQRSEQPGSPAPNASADASAEKSAPAPVPAKSEPAQPALEVARAPEANQETAPPRPLAESAAGQAQEKSDDKATQLGVQLAATQAALERVSQRLQTLEGQLAAPKLDTRADQLASREMGPGSKEEASARIVVAQSLLTALRQGDDYRAQLDALQDLGGDPARLDRLRASVGTPDVAKLTASFVALTPKIAASVAPPPQTAQPAQAAQPAHGFGEAVWSFVESRAKKIVRVRSAGAPDGDATAALVDDIEQKLLRGDLAGALGERAQLPAPALALTADWAKGAQARLDAEEAAKSELNDSLQALTKHKS